MFRHTCRLGALTLALTFTVPTAQADYLVPGRANPWLAGMPDGTPANDLNRAPSESPTLVTGFFRPGAVLTFAATGGVRMGPAHPLDPPDGRTGPSEDHRAGAEHGIADVVAPISSLIGVFLSDERPDQTPAPARLEFHRTDGTVDFLTLSPLLKQVFFIGDGRTSMGALQEVLVPEGATRLFLGTKDRYGWYNNLGQFNVTVNATAPVPEPSTLAIAGLAVLGLAGYGWRRKRAECPSVRHSRTVDPPKMTCGLRERPLRSFSLLPELTPSVCAWKP